MDGQGNIFLPSNIGATAMTEREICELFGVIAPTVRAGIKALCKSGVLSVYDIKRIIRISDKYSAEVYNLETIAALAFTVNNRKYTLNAGETQWTAESEASTIYLGSEKADVCGYYP